MEDFKIDIMIETGPNARSVQISLNPFTLVGATTRSGLLTAPMRARFGIQSRLQYYNTELLTTIVQRTIDLKITLFALEALNVDENGLDEMDNRILKTIIEKFKGGPVGLTTFATAVGENGETLEEVYEPFLIQEGFLMRTPRGREVTEKAYKHLGKLKLGNQEELF